MSLSRECYPLMEEVVEEVWQIPQDADRVGAQTSVYLGVEAQELAVRAWTEAVGLHMGGLEDLQDQELRQQQYMAIRLIRSCWELVVVVDMGGLQEPGEGIFRCLFQGL
jgi:hypothetical protein